MRLRINVCLVREISCRRNLIFRKWSLPFLLDLYNTFTYIDKYMHTYIKKIDMEDRRKLNFIIICLLTFS